MKEETTKKNWHKTRKLFNDIHLWLGLSSGLIIFLVCLSGTIYTYNTEIREMAAPHLYKVEAQSNKKELDDLVNTIKQEYPGEITGLSIPSSPNRSYAFTLRPPNDKSRFGITYYVNPYTGALLGTSETKTKTDELMGYLFSLHRWLLLDKIEKPIFCSLENRKLGSYITGGATILFTLGLLTGMVIWFPRKIKSWRKGLKIKFNSNWKRINHDLHNSLGLYALVFLLLMGLTGPQWSFDWYRTGLRKSLGTYQESPKAGSKSEGKKHEGKTNPSEKDQLKNNDVDENKASLEYLPLEDYLASASASLNYKADYRLSFPKSSEDPIQVRANKTGFFAPAAADEIEINRKDASVLTIALFKNKAFNERISGSIKALHIGNVYGQFSKLIYFLACLIATSLPVTGTLIWINKMKKTKKRPSKKKVVQP